MTYTCINYCGENGRYIYQYHGRDYGRYIYQSWRELQPVHLSISWWEQWSTHSSIMSGTMTDTFINHDGNNGQHINQSWRK